LPVAYFVPLKFDQIVESNLVLQIGKKKFRKCTFHLTVLSTLGEKEISNFANLMKTNLWYVSKLTKESTLVEKPELIPSFFCLQLLEDLFEKSRV